VVSPVSEELLAGTEISGGGGRGRLYLVTTLSPPE